MPIPDKLESLHPVFGRIFFGNSVFDYIVALILFILIALVVSIIGRATGNFVSAVCRRTNRPILTLVSKAYNRLRPILSYIPVIVVVHYLKVPERVVQLFDAIWLIIIAYCAVRFVQDTVNRLLGHNVEKGKLEQRLVTSVSLLMPFILWPVAILFVLSNLGVNITTLVAGLGVGGVAVALASQTILADLFNFFTIIISKPFGIGDFVEVSGVSGTVESIGLKGTRITSVTGEQLVISNTNMTAGVLKNFQIMRKRRVRFNLGLRYDTSATKVKALPKQIEAIIEAHSEAEVDVVTFAAFGASSLDFEVSYFVLSSSAIVMKQVSEEINFSILDLLEAEAIGLAFPSSSVYMEKMQ